MKGHATFGHQARAVSWSAGLSAGTPVLMLRRTKEAFYSSMSFSADAQPVFVASLSLPQLSMLNQTSIHGTYPIRFV